VVQVFRHVHHGAIQVLSCIAYHGLLGMRGGACDASNFDIGLLI
jgi:hypothetical protein